MQDSNEKFEIVDGVSYRYSASWIHTLESEDHWRLYWRQEKIMQGFVVRGQHVLEMGVGSGFTANYLRSKGIDVTTIDIDAEKRPDIVANIVKYPFVDSYDHILAFEIFEHVPFDAFRNVLERIVHVCKGNLFLSVPRNQVRWFMISVQLPKSGSHSFSIKTPRGKIKEKSHFWEVGHNGITRSKLESTFREAGFEILAQEEAFSRLFYVLNSPNVQKRKAVKILS